MLRKGDIVVFNKKLKRECTYTITNQYMIKGKVEETWNSGANISVRVLDHENQGHIGETHGVRAKYFILKNDVDEYLLS